MKMKVYFALILTLTFLMTVSGCVSNTPATYTAAATSATATSFEPTETAAVATPTPTPATLETVVTLPVPATYASLYDGLKLYSDGSRTIILKTLVKGDQVTITGTAGQYGVTADGAFINLHLMIVVITVTATPTPEETTAAPAVPTSATTAKPTTKPTAAATTAGTTAATTAAPTAAPVTSLSASEVEDIVWSAVIDARSANGFTTNKSDILSTRCRENANRLACYHTGNNGDLESVGNIGEKSDGKWGVMLTAGQTNFASLSDAAFAMGRELITDHVPQLSTDARYTEFGVGVVKQVIDARTTYYYVYVSGAIPEDLQWQIDQGWYS